MATEKRLIDAMNTVMKISKRVTPQIAQGCHQQRVYAEVLQVIAEAPTVDAVEVKHGRWTEAEDGDGAVCSVCGEDFCNVYLEVERFLYCPNCGAKMDGDGNA